jgi:hypothetical protein
MRWRPILALAGLGLGCGGPGGLVVPLPDAAVAPAPAGVDAGPYPTANVGGKPRTRTTAGQVFPNFTLEGIRSVATIDERAEVSMAEIYDPAGTRYDLLHVVAVFFWCPHCNNETNALAKLASWRAEHRVAVIEIAMQGYGSSSPGWSELQEWVRDHALDFPVLVDGQGGELGQFFPIGSVPLNIAVDPRTMEILSVDVGEVADMTAYEQGFLAGS